MYEKLEEYIDDKYKEFSKSLIPNTKYTILGVKIPILRKIAKKISKGDYIKYISNNEHNFFEEVMIHGLIIGYININIDDIIKLFKEYVPYIDNWSLCDSTVNNLKIIYKYPSKGLSLVKWCLKHKKEYYKRTGYVLLLNYYINDLYIDIIYELCDKYISNDYYVQMSVAWLLSECFYKYPEKTINYLKQNKLDKWTHNKTIQKINESNKISKDSKNNINIYKR